MYHTCKKGNFTLTVKKEVTQREEIEPAHWVENDILYDGQATLAISGDGKAYANGSWTKSYEVTPGKYYEFNTVFKPKNITQINRTILSQIIWKSNIHKLNNI